MSGFSGSRLPAVMGVKRHRRKPSRGQHGISIIGIEGLVVPIFVLATHAQYLSAYSHIIQHMSETYQSKRERWQRLLETLPAGLREHVALRNVEAVAALSPQAQARLAEAIRSGLQRLSPAVEKLKVNPNLPIAELLDPTVSLPIPEYTTQVQSELVDMIQQCFPDMPRISAEALAEAGLMDTARTIGLAHHSMLASDHLKTDFVMLVLYGLMHQTLEQLDELIEQTPSLRQALHQSSLPWKPNDWRKNKTC